MSGQTAAQRSLAEAWVRYQHTHSTADLEQVMNLTAVAIEEKNDRIAALEAEVARLESQLSIYASGGVVEIGAVNFNVSSYCEHWEGRAEAAERRADRLAGLLGWTVPFVQAGIAHFATYPENRPQIPDFKKKMDECLAALADEPGEKP